MANVTTLNPNADTYISSNTPTTSYGSGSDIYAGEYNAGSDVARTLIKFDLSGIPAGSTIIGARLKIRDVASNFSSNNRNLQVYRMLRSWTEGTATWNTTDGSTSWGTAGAGNTTNDRESSSIGTVSTPATEVADWYEIQLTASAVQEMFDGTITNNGFMLKMDTETDDMHRYYSRTGTNPPQLIITYVTSGSGIVVYAHSSSGHIRASNAVWSTSRGAATGTDTGDAYIGAELSGGNYDIYRGFFKFNTSGLIPATATITSGTFKLYLSAGDLSNAFNIGITEHTAPDTTLSTADFDALTLNSPTELATRWTASTPNNAYVDFSLNASGITAINNFGYTKIAVRSSKDIDNSTPTLRSYFGYSGDFTYDPPQLVIEYSLPSDVGGIIII